VKRIVVAGYPLGHSLSPVMHNAALSELGLSDEFTYEAWILESDQLPTLVESIRGGELEGANITIPYKTRVMSYIAIISDIGQAVGAVNTLYRESNDVAGCNTDVVGLTKAIEETGVILRGLSVAILGAGGAAKAVAFALVQAGVDKLFIANRSLPSAERLAKAVGRHKQTGVSFGDVTGSERRLSDSDLIVNCTPVGMKGHSINETPLEKHHLSEGQTVMDLVYNPLQTKFLKEANEMGCETIGGAGMLVHQGAASFEMWTGKAAPVEVMRKAVLRALRGGPD
jgi:shikimate dehydrogenase